jgi:hypothetical protein
MRWSSTAYYLLLEWVPWKLIHLFKGFIVPEVSLSRNNKYREIWIKIAISDFLNIALNTQEHVFKNFISARTFENPSQRCCLEIKIYQFPRY